MSTLSTAQRHVLSSDRDAGLIRMFRTTCTTQKLWFFAVFHGGGCRGHSAFGFLGDLLIRRKEQYANDQEEIDG